MSYVACLQSQQTTGPSPQPRFAGASSNAPLTCLPVRAYEVSTLQCIHLHERASLEEMSRMLYPRRQHRKEKKTQLEITLGVEVCCGNLQGVKQEGMCAGKHLCSSILILQLKNKDLT